MTSSIMVHVVCRPENDETHEALEFSNLQFMNTTSNMVMATAHQKSFGMFVFVLAQ